MSQRPSEKDTGPFPVLSLAAGIGGGVLLLLAVAVTVQFRMNDQRQADETTVDFTASDDSRYFPAPQAGAPPPPDVAVEVGDRALYVLDTRPLEFAPEEMARAGRDERRGFAIYQAKGNAGERESVWFVKIAPKQFLKVAPRKADGAAL